MRPLQVGGRTAPDRTARHWGPNAHHQTRLELINVSLDPNVHIMESKAGTCDIQPGRRPRGPALLQYVEEYRRRAGITEFTGTEHLDSPHWTEGGLR